MRHDDERGADAPLHVHELELRLLAQAPVERAERFVEQQDLRLARERTRERHALALPAGELVGAALAELLEPHELQHLRHARLAPVARQALLAQAERDVLAHAQVGEQRVALEHQVHGPLVRRHGRHVDAVDEDAAGIGPLEPREHAQQRALAGARAAEQREEFALHDVERNVVDGDDVGEALADALQPQVRRGGHWPVLIRVQARTRSRDSSSGTVRASTSFATTSGAG